MSWYDKILKGKPDDEEPSFRIEGNANLKWIANQTVINSYQLIEDHRIIGSLVFTKNSRRIADGKVYGLEFIIKSHWFFRNKILIQQSGSLKKCTMIITDLHKSGMIEFGNKECLFWNCLNSLKHEWAFSNKGNKKLIVFKPVTSFYKSGYFVRIKSKEFDKPSLAVLLLIGIYNLLNLKEDVGITSAFF